MLTLLSSASFTPLQAQDELDEQVPYQGDTLLINPNQVRETTDGDILMDCDWPTMMSMIRDLEERIAGETETDTVYGVYVSGALVGSSLNMWHDCLVLRDSIEALQVAYNDVLSPGVTTNAPSILSDTSAVLNATFTGSGITALGFNWGTDENLAGAADAPVTGTASPFSDTLMALLPGTAYYVSAYATKGTETVNGDTLSLLTMPGITTVDASAVTGSSATLNATFSADSITAQGFVWGLQANLSDGASVSADTTDGSTAIETALTGLTTGTVHYFNAFATNASGTTRGDTLSFTPVTPITDSNIQEAVYLWVDNEASATTTYGDITEWNTSAVTDMAELFKSKDTFNDDISEWVVSNVTNMQSMFYQATAFNRDIGDWNVSNVTTMKNMFREAAAFNQDIGDWNVSNVTNMNAMFKLAALFNQDLSQWCVENLAEPSNFGNQGNNPVWEQQCPVVD